MTKELTAEQKARKKLMDALRYQRQKDQSKARVKAWKEANKERVQEYKKQYRSENAGKIAAYNEANKDRQAAWREAHREEAVAYGRAYRIENGDVIRQKERLKYRAHPEQTRKATRASYLKNPEAAKAYSKKHRTKRKDLHAVYAENKRVRKMSGDGKLSSNLVALLLAEQGSCCPYCLRDLRITGINLDHYVPLALGGPHQDSNIQLTCPSCNSRKRAKHPLDFLREIMDLCERMAA